MRRFVGPLALSLVISACGGGTGGPDPSIAPVSEIPAPVVGVTCFGGDFQARSALYESVKAAVPADVPSQLSMAIEAVPPTLLGGLIYAGCSAEQVDDLKFEQMAWTNGIGLLLVSWQEWPGDGDIIGVPFGGSAHQAGVVEVSAIDEMAIERTRVVHLFDGVRVVTVATYSLTTLSVEQAEEIAWAVYDAIPVDASNRVGVGASRSLDEFLAALSSDQVLVGDTEGLSEMSPFTATMGMAHATYLVTAAGSTLTVFDFGGVGAADRAAAAVSSDGYTIAHVPYDVTATPHYWQWDRLIVRYMGGNALLIARLDEVVGPSFAGESG